MRGFLLDAPSAVEVGGALHMPARVAIVMWPIAHDALGISEVAARVTEVKFGRDPIAYGAGLIAVAHRFHRGRKIRKRRTQLLQRFLNLHLALGVGALAEMVVPNFPLAIDEVFRGPILVRVRAPDRIV